MNLACKYFCLHSYVNCLLLELALVASKYTDIENRSCGNECFVLLATTLLQHAHMLEDCAVAWLGAT